MRPGMEAALDFDQTPMVVIWEITRACALACRHCRAEAIPHRDPRELTTAEGMDLMDQVRALGSPIFVMTGGDPVMRPDFYDLITYGTSIGLRVAASPSGTRLVTRDAMSRAAAAGLTRVSFSLDGASSATHDRFRGVAGSYEWTMTGIQAALKHGMEVQVNTTVARPTVGELPAIAEQVQAMGASLWSLFFLVTTGRALADDVITPTEHEEVLRWMWHFSRTTGCAVKATEAPFYRRVVAEAAAAAGVPAPQVSAGVNDGKGFVFISHIGEIQPSGFLPVTAGLIRQHSLADVYRTSPVFTALRDPSRLKGKCGACEYRSFCGGSRSRAYAATGDFLASDPACPYVPTAAARERV